MGLIYVDDIIVTGNDSKQLQLFTSKLNKTLALKDLGALSYFLGIEVVRDSSGMYLSQEKYVTEMLKKFNMVNLKPCPTPMTVGKSMFIEDGELLKDPTLYRSLIGGMQYLAHTRLDISFSVNKLSQFLKAPTTTHWSAVKRILRYSKGNIHHGLHIKYSERLTLTSFSDADWACCPDDRKSVAGYCIFFGDTLISLSSKKQTVVARSST
ncbi:uncharacterized mitochondrial protein AtMg00810-like [Humulus lupulus]|uniref:uncharacterized mitochondrial protein AtMg00810-like n=1 Tax=Humulus lupulus TaxID=3486 RepID=UPI002B405634|nr:uncharacterized mitochondrial protein AtMg00810-like [Humulus lupulus]